MPTIKNKFCLAVAFFPSPVWDISTMYAINAPSPHLPQTAILGTKINIHADKEIRDTPTVNNKRESN